ncbi:MAG: hypothetical protein AAF539_15730, partial [Planctomycetota bacterium]
MATTINLGQLSAIEAAPRTTVWTKTSWSDAWGIDNRFMVLETRHAIAPSVATATLEYRFGESVQTPGTVAVRNLPKLTGRGYYVLIRHELAGVEPRWWVGYADSPITVAEYNDTVTGVQHVPCYGLERAFQYTEIRTTVHDNPNADPGDSSTEIIRSPESNVFNPTGMRPSNRSKDKLSGSSPFASYVFANPADDDLNWWSTRDIFEHLIVWHLPTNDYGIGVIPFAASSDMSQLPAWDNPTIDPFGKTLFDVLSELLSADRMLGWCLQPTISIVGNVPSVDSVAIRPFTMLTQSLSLPSIGDLPANARIFNLIDTGDDLTDSILQTDDTDSVDQVIVEGPPEIAICTLRHQDEFVKDWTDDQEDDYELALTNAAGFDALDAYQKRDYVTFVRSNAKFRNVYRRFKIKDDWNGECNEEPAFLNLNDPNDSNAITFVPYLGTLRVLPDLPLFRGVEYDGPVADVDESTGRFRLPILAYLNRFGQDKFWVLQNFYSSLGGPNFRRPQTMNFEASVVADNERGPGFELRLLGAPRHAIDNQFTPSDGDPEKASPGMWGDLDYRDVEVTVALQGGRRPSFSIPASAPGDLARRRILRFDHEFLS